VFLLKDQIVSAESLRERLLATPVRDRAILVAVKDDDRHYPSAHAHSPHRGARERVRVRRQLVRG
jgi:hypothetical protein